MLRPLERRRWRLSDVVTSARLRPAVHNLKNLCVSKRSFPIQSGRAVFHCAERSSAGVAKLLVMLLELHTVILSAAKSLFISRLGFLHAFNDVQQIDVVQSL